MTSFEQDATAKDLLRRYQARDEVAFEQLYDLHSEGVRVIVQRTLKLKPKDPGIDDVCQKVWLAVIRKASGYRGEGRFTSWLFGIVRIVCLLELEEAKRERERRAEYEAHLRPNPPIVAVARILNVPHETARKRFQRCVARLRRLLARFGPDFLAGPDLASD